MKQIKKWEVIKEETVLDSKWFPISKHTVKLANGKIVDDYYVSTLGNVALVLAITKNREIVMVRQYRHGAQIVALELPAGRVENYTTQETAIKELEEEAGIKVASVELIGNVYVSPSKESVQTIGYFVDNVEFNSKQQLDETEDIEVVLVPVDEVEQKIKNGEINSVDTVAFFYLAKLKNLL